MKRDLTAEEVYYQYCKLVFQFCMHLTNENQYDSEDITNDVFRIFFEEQDNLKFDLEPAIITWLYRTAKNKWMNLSKHMKKWRKEDDETDIFSRQFSDDEEEKQFQEYLTEIEKNLSGFDLDLFHAIAVEKLSYKEISNRSGISEQALRVRWHRLKNKIRPLMNKMINP